MPSSAQNLTIKSSRKSFLQNASTVHFQTFNDQAFIKLRALFSHKFNANGFNTIKRLEKLFREQTAMTDGLMTIRELKHTVRNIEWDEGISKDSEGMLPEVGNVHLKLTDKDFETIFLTLDDQRSGKLHFEQFLQAIRGPMSPDRMLLVDLAFEKLDVDGKGFLTGKDISKFCSYAIIPDLLNGKKTVNEIVFEFLKDFGGERNFKVSREKFVNYYLYLNFLIESDDAFEDHLFNQWSITSDEYKAYLFDLSKKESVLIEKLSGDALSPRIENDPLEPISVSEADKVEYITLATAYKASPPKKNSPHSNSFLRSLRQERKSFSGSPGSFSRPSGSFSAKTLDVALQGDEMPESILQGDSLQAQVQMLPMPVQMHIFGLEERVKMLTKEKEELEADYDGLSAAFAKLETEMHKIGSTGSSFTEKQSLALTTEVVTLTSQLNSKDEVIAMLTATNQSQDNMIKMMQQKFLSTN